MTAKSRLLSAAVLLLGLPASSVAQVSIQVIDSQGRPVADVSVEVYGRGELFEVVSTSARGIAEMSSERWAEVRRITLRHLAFPTLIVQADDIPADGVIRFEPRATSIEGFVVQGRDLCPVEDDPEARRLWSEAASRYAPDTGTRSWSAYFSRYGDRVVESDLHRRTSDSEAVGFVSAGGPFVIHGTDHTARPLSERVLGEGYAWPPLVVGGTTRAREVAWAYPDLDGEHAYHFATPEFGALHDFAVANESTNETSLVFCGDPAGAASTLRGVITVAEGEFVRAEWGFETGEPDEHAGGAVSFASLSDPSGGRPHLVASRGLFYRKSGVLPQSNSDYPIRYVRFVTTEYRWHLNPSAEKPCNEGISYHRYPARTEEGRRFAACIEENWGR